MITPTRPSRRDDCGICAATPATRGYNGWRRVGTGPDSYLICRPCHDSEADRAKDPDR